jgi:ABC-type sugar transport system ATPase subunit
VGSEAGQFEALRITHDYSGVVVLHGVDFEMRRGSVTGLVGENGSGKSTLIKVLTGALRPSAGTVKLDGEPVTFRSPADAQRLGIGVVHQDYNLFPDLSVAENIYGVSEKLPRRRWSPFADKVQVKTQVRQLLHRLDIDIPPDTLVRALGAAERKFVELARAMLLRPRFLILDEPTASLEPGASAAVLSLIDRLREANVGLCFISHRLDEVIGISERITALRNGFKVGEVDTGVASEGKLAELIIGRRLDDAGGQEKAGVDGGAPPTGDVILRVDGLRTREDAPPVRIELHRGEILGLAGLVGAGPATVVRMLGGAQPLVGHVEVSGRECDIRNPRDAREAGIGFVPEDRKAEGLVPEQDVVVNISLASLESVSTAGFLAKSGMVRRAHEYREKLDIRLDSVRMQAKALSGGNAQKVLLAKWLASGVNIMAVEEPTHGVDIGAKAQVHRLLRAFADQGGSIIMASTDNREVLSLCDRIAIFRHGAIRTILSPSEMRDRAAGTESVEDPEHLLEALITSD